MDDVGLGLPIHGTKLELAVSEKSRKAPYSKQFVSGYHADTPITIKAEAIRKADSRSH